MYKKISILISAIILLSACQTTDAKPAANNINLKDVTTTVVTTTPTPTIDNEVEKLLNLKPNQQMYVTIKTSKGNIKAQLFPDKAPNTVANFVGLAEGTKIWTDPKTNKPVTGKSLYAGTVFHRVISGFMIQGGDPIGNGTGGPGYRFADEKTDESYTRGTLAMANSGPNTNGSQFFIMHADYPLPPSYTIFGRIDSSDSASLKVVDSIATTPTGPNDRPKDPITIESILVQRQ